MYIYIRYLFNSKEKILRNQENGLLSRQWLMYQNSFSIVSMWIYTWIYFSNWQLDAVAISYIVALMFIVLLTVSTEWYFFNIPIIEHTYITDICYEVFLKVVNIALIVIFPVSCRCCTHLFYSSKLIQDAFIWHTSVSTVFPAFFW